MKAAKSNLCLAGASSQIAAAGERVKANDPIPHLAFTSPKPVVY
jgi:hypothetical protein